MNITKQSLLNKPILDVNSALFDFYQYYLAISSDTLIVVDKVSRDLLEVIVQGSDNEAYLCSFGSEDEFLEAISYIKYVFKVGGGLDLKQFLYEIWRA